jgi:hypothetical protein
MVVEVDAMPGGHVCSASVKGARPAPRSARSPPGRRAVVLPRGERILELSTKCALAEGFQVAAETRAFLDGKGVDSPVRRSLSPTARLGNPPDLDQFQAEQPGPGQDPEQCGLVGEAAA